MATISFFADLLNALKIISIIFLHFSNECTHV